MKTRQASLLRSHQRGALAPSLRVIYLTGLVSLLSVVGHAEPIAQAEPAARGKNSAANVNKAPAAAPTPNRGVARPVLTLLDGGRISGDLVPTASDTGGKRLESIGWQGTDFVSPFEFSIDLIRSVVYPVAAKPEKASAEFQIHTVNQGAMSGTIRRWTNDAVEIESPRLGNVSIRLSEIYQIFRIDGNPLVVYPGLTSLDDWRKIGNIWHSEGSSFVTTFDDAQIVADVELPSRALVEIDLSWKKSSTFSIGIGVDPTANGDKLRDGWRLESWQDRLNLIREFRGRADVITIADMAKTQSAQLLVYLDQAKNEITVLNRDGRLAGRVAFLPDDMKKERKPRPGIRVINTHGELHLERLRVSRWTGDVPEQSAVVENQIVLSLSDGSRLSGQFVGVSAEEVRLTIDSEEKGIPLKTVSSMTFSRKAEPASKDPALKTDEKSEKNAVVQAEKAPAVQSEFRLVFQDGTQLTGTVASVGNKFLTIISPDLEAPAQVERGQLRLISRLSKPAEVPKPEMKGRLGQLALGEYRTQGVLVPASETDLATCFAWQPVGATSASALKPGTAGRIVYQDREPSAKGPGNTAAPEKKTRPGGNFGKIFLKKVNDPAPKAPTKTVVESKLHLRSGDIVPGIVVAAGEDGVMISSPVAGERLIPHVKIKAIELVTSTTLPKLKVAKKERLLTVPRAQTGSPPTHLLCSKTGDFLRCRLIAIEASTIKIEIQLGEIVIPRDRVAQIIWFHPDEIDGVSAITPDASTNAAANPPASTSSGKEPAGENATKPAEQAPPEAASLYGHLAQVIRPDGNRVTFDPVSVNAEAIQGTSDVIGDCRFEISKIDQLIFGQQITSSAATLVFQQWRLHHAKLPLVAQDLAPGASDQGGASPLVGKAAPDFELDFLAGGKFKLSKAKGKIVVLDFWATWCGPCMQTMPLVEEAMKEYDPQKVQLISVNLEEPAKNVKSVLERHKLNVPVVMDIDGIVGRKYEANAIPQLVIIDTEGKVARLFVGGGPTVVTEMKGAINELLSLPKQPAK